MRNLIPSLLPAILFSTFLAGAAGAQQRTYTVYRAQTPPTIDGRLDDECWRAVPWQTGFTLLGGGAVAEATQTQFAMVWDDQCLYIAVRCKEPAMDRLAAKADDGSNDVFRDDHVEVFLASEKEREDYFQFAVNSLNKRIDLSYEAKKVTATLAISKGGKWVSACRRDKAQWELEMALPLAALKFAPAEGAVLAGNIARSRRAEQPDQPANTTWTPLTNGFDRDPEAFGTFKLAGAPPAMMRTLSLAVEQRHDVVSTLQGDHYTGAVLGIAADGWLHMNGPQFGGEVTVASAVVSRVEFSPARAEKSGPRITFYNGDYVRGEVKSITPEQTVVVSPEIGTLTAPTASVSEIVMGGGGSANSVDTGFESGTLEPWTAVQGRWNVAGGKAVSSGGGPMGESVLSVPLTQKGPITFIADVEGQAQNQLQCELVVFSSQANHQNGMGSGVSFNFWGQGGSVMVMSPDMGMQQLGNWQANQFMTSARIQLQYDPKEGLIQPWVNDQPAGQYRFNAGPKTGKYVLLVAHGPVAVKHLRVVPGIVAPSKGPAAATDSVQIMLVNGDTLSAKAVSFADGKFTVATDFGEINPELKRVESIRFPRRAAAPAAKEAEATVQTTEGSFSVRDCLLSDENLTAQSDLFGQLTLKRDLLRAIRFHRGATP